MQQSSKHHYPDSFESLSSGSSYGHIEHQSVEMDPHDRAVQRSAGKHAAKKSSGLPWILLCLFLFAALVVFFVLRIPSLFPSADKGTVVITQDDTPSVEVSSVPELAGDNSGVTNSGEPDSLPASGSGDSAVISVETEFVPTPSPIPTAEPVHVHSYVNGVCSGCGKTPDFYTGYLPEEYYQENKHPGTIVRHEYDVTAYANYGNGTYHKALNIYLPYGYTEEKPYNVLVLVPGYGGDEESWLNTVYESGGYQMCGKNIVDNLFDSGACEPCIIVTPVAETAQCQGLTAGINQLRQELREDILPYIVSNYSTYAADSSLDSLRAARDHFGLGGLSNGALFVFEGGMRYNFDLFGSYAAFSGNGEPWKTVGIIQDEEYAALPINCFFAGAGSYNDPQQNYTKIGYDYFLENEQRLEENKNAWRVDVEGEHEWKVWLTDLANALPLMFQKADLT